MLKASIRRSVVLTTADTGSYRTTVTLRRGKGGLIVGVFEMGYTKTRRQALDQVWREMIREGEWKYPGSFLLEFKKSFPLPK